MTIHQYLFKAAQDDARRAGERDRVLLEAQRSRATGRQHASPVAAPASRLARILFRRATAQPSVTVPSPDELTALSGQASLIVPPPVSS